MQDMACGIDLNTENIFKAPDDRPLWFYDSWVSRDAGGNMITGEHSPAAVSPTLAAHATGSEIAQALTQ